MPTALLADRAVLFIGGEEVHSFLQGLITANIEKTNAETALFSALLSPQGKIQFDFFLTPHEEGFYVDIDQDRAADFLKRLTLYRLRSKVTLKNVSDEKSVLASWDEEASSSIDSRLAALGSRLIVPKDEKATTSSAAYHANRLKLGVPEAGKDFAYDSIFPHDAMMDCLRGVDFKKGCYIGQEVISRVEHRSTARKRFFKVKADASIPETAFDDVSVDDKVVGSMGSSQTDEGLALLRIDRMQEDKTVHLGELTLTASLPDYFENYLETKKS